MTRLVGATIESAKFRDSGSYSSGRQDPHVMVVLGYINPVRHPTENACLSLSLTPNTKIVERCTSLVLLWDVFCV